MSAKHSPGPWFIFGNDHCVGAPFTPRTDLGDDPKQTTAGIAMCGMKLRTPAEIKANARLIAAAPDLLAALRDVEWAGQADREDGGYAPACPFCGETKDDGHLHCKLAAAIAKAEGREAQ